MSQCLLTGLKEKTQYNKQMGKKLGTQFQPFVTCQGMTVTEYHPLGVNIGTDEEHTSCQLTRQKSENEIEMRKANSIIACQVGGILPSQQESALGPFHSCS